MGISTEFDQKEAMFRNFGRVMGVFSTPVIMHRWEPRFTGLRLMGRMVIMHQVGTTLYWAAFGVLYLYGHRLICFRVNRSSSVSFFGCCFF